MTSPRRLAWLGFAATAAVLVGVLAWLTTAMQRLDQDELHARRQATLHERLRLALWRMDSWLAPLLAREAGRPPSDWQAFAAAGNVWTAAYTKVSPDAVTVASPLLEGERALFPLYFEFGPNGLSSPQVPVGLQRDNYVATGHDPATFAAAEERLRRFGEHVTRAAIEQRLGGREAMVPDLGCNLVSPSAPVQTQQSVLEFSNRQRGFAQNVMRNDPTTEVGGGHQAGETVGPLLPFWLDAGGEARLVFARRVGTGAAARVQGMLADWPSLSTELTALVADLFPAGAARLVRCDEPLPAEQPSMLASVPARLEAPCDETLTSGLPLPWMLGTTWGVTLLGLLVLGFTLRTAIGYGERRARFASAVTHELRTPLTTFRMYSEMLADGVVTDPAAQRDYLQTLQRESDRLARVVENVLAWSRLEEGRFASRRVPQELGPLLDRVTPPLQRRLADAGMTLELHVDDAARAETVTTDEDAVGQVLFNLVDNAAKYAREAREPRVVLAVARAGDRWTFTVRDHGPGVQAPHRERIFAPFDRGAVAAGSNDVPGVGLGLALARGLARDLGGELRLDPAVRDGAAFVLELPAA